MYFTVLNRHANKLYKNKINSKFIKSYQSSLERSHAVLTEISPEFWSWPSPFTTKTDPYRSTSHKFTKTEQRRFFYSVTLCLATSHQ